MGGLVTEEAKDLRAAQWRGSAWDRARVKAHESNFTPAKVRYGPSRCILWAQPTNQADSSSPMLKLRESSSLLGVDERLIDHVPTQLFRAGEPEARTLTLTIEMRQTELVYSRALHRTARWYVSARSSSGQADVTVGDAAVREHL
jgi:hypothetical protein